MYFAKIVTVFVTKITSRVYIDTLSNTKLAHDKMTIHTTGTSDNLSRKTHLF